jgi:hypothetical protein
MMQLEVNGKIYKPERSNMDEYYSYLLRETGDTNIARMITARLFMTICKFGPLLAHGRN